MNFKKKLKNAVFTLAALAALSSSASGLEQKIIDLIPLRTAQKIENIRKEIPAVYWTESDLEALPDPSFMNSDFIKRINNDLRRDHLTQYIVFVQGTNREDFLGHVQDMEKILSTGHPAIRYFTSPKGFLYQGIFEIAAESMEDSNYVEDGSEPEHYTLFPPFYYFSRAHNKSIASKKKSKFLKDYRDYHEELSGLIKRLGFDLYIPLDLNLLEENSNALFTKPVCKSIIYPPQILDPEKRIKKMPYLLIENPPDIGKLKEIKYKGIVFKIKY